MSYVSGSHTYGLAAAQTDLPPSFGSSTLPRPISTSVQLVNLAAQSADQNAGGLISFQIPTGASSSGYLKNNSMYLRCKVTIPVNLAHTAGFQLASQSASAIINRVTVSINGVVISQINNYHLLHEMLLTHATTSGYYDRDSSILEYTGNAAPFIVANNPSVNCVLPLVIPLFNGDKAVPLFLLNAPIQVNIDLNPYQSAILATANDATTYSVSNAQLVYELIHVDANYIQEVKGALAQGNAYQLNLHDFYTMQTATGGTVNYNIGCNYSSVRGVLYTQTIPAVDGTATKMYDNTQTDFKLYLDGRQVNNFAIDNKSVVFAEMNRALGNMFDSTITSNCDATTFLTTKFTGGICTNRVSDVMAMTGSPAQNINFVLTSGGANNAVVYIVVLFDQILTIDAAGSVMLIK